MAGHDSPIDESKFTGLSKYFNSFTPSGRANTAKATYASVALIFIYFKFLRPSKKTEEVKPLT